MLKINENSVSVKCFDNIGSKGIAFTPSYDGELREVKKLAKEIEIDIKGESIETFVTYKVELGGVKDILGFNTLELYASEDNYRSGVKINETKTSLGYLFGTTINCKSSKIGNMLYFESWAYINDEITEFTGSNHFRFVFDSNNKLYINGDKTAYDKTNTWKSRQDYFDLHSYKVVLADGTEQERKALLSPIMLNGDQEKLADELEHLITKMESIGMQIFWDDFKERLVCFNGHVVSRISDSSEEPDGDSIEYSRFIKACRKLDTGVAPIGDDCAIKLMSNAE